MNKGSMIAIFSLSLIAGMASLKVPCEGLENNDVIDLYENILIGELFPSGNVYLERFSLDDGFDNLQHFEGLNYSKKDRSSKRS